MEDFWDNKEKNGVSGLAMTFAVAAHVFMVMEPLFERENWKKYLGGGVPYFHIFNFLNFCLNGWYGLPQVSEHHIFLAIGNAVRASMELVIISIFFYYQSTLVRTHILSAFLVCLYSFMCVFSILQDSLEGELKEKCFGWTSAVFASIMWVLGTIEYVKVSIEKDGDSSIKNWYGVASMAGLFSFIFLLWYGSAEKDWPTIMVAIVGLFAMLVRIPAISIMEGTPYRSAIELTPHVLHQEVDEEIGAS